MYANGPVCHALSWGKARAAIEFGSGAIASTRSRGPYLIECASHLQLYISGAPYEGYHVDWLRRGGARRCGCDPTFSGAGQSTSQPTRSPCDAVYGSTVQVVQPWYNGAHGFSNSDLI